MTAPRLTSKQIEILRNLVKKRAYRAEWPKWEIGSFEFSGHHITKLRKLGFIEKTWDTGRDITPEGRAYLASLDSEQC